ncbi:MAG: ferredoxin:CoB-CoM heterodisulfide reductase subunit HdrC [Methanobrevibacter sp.]
MGNEFQEGTLDLANFIMADLKFTVGDNLLKCVQCGMCTSTCPGAQHSNYNPRDMIEKILKGETSIIDDEYLWYCFYCYTCHSTCPVGNSPCQANQVLRQIKISRGEADAHLRPFLGFGYSFLNNGIGGIPPNFFPEMREDIGDDWWDFKCNLDDIRENLGLGPVIPPKETIDEVSTILKQAGFEKRLEEVKRIKDNEKVEKSTE